jgi:voltage-gated sodium channel
MGTNGLSGMNGPDRVLSNGPMSSVHSRSAGDDDEDPNSPKRGKTFEEIEMIWGLGSNGSAAHENFVDGAKFNLAVGLVILANAMVIGIETEFCRNNGCQESELIWRTIEYVFCAVWVVEMVLRLRAHGLKYFFDPWNVMDFGLVTLAIADAVLPTVQSVLGRENEQRTDNMKMFSVLRMLRLLRLVRVIRLLRIFKELWLLVNGFIHALRVLGWLVVLLLLILYCGAVLTTAMIGEHCDEDYVSFDRCKDMFGGVLLSMFTLFQVLTLEGWAMSVVRPVIAVSPSLVYFFFIFSLPDLFRAHEHRHRRDRGKHAASCGAERRQAAESHGKGAARQPDVASRNLHRC